MKVGTVVRIGQILEALKGKWDHLKDQRRIFHLTYEGRTLDENMTISQLMNKLGFKHGGTLELMAVLDGGIELPEEIWTRRINNEIKLLRAKGIDVQEKKKLKTSRELLITFEAEGYQKSGTRQPQKLNQHAVKLTLKRSYPYPGSIDPSWASDIFHPNIEPSTPSFGGRICLNFKGSSRSSTKYLALWEKTLDLYQLVKWLKFLVENPNPDDGYAGEATKWFRDNKKIWTRKSREIKPVKDDSSIAFI